MRNGTPENRNQHYEKKLSTTNNYASIRSAKLRRKERGIKMQKLQLQKPQLELEKIEDEEKTETYSRNSNFKIESREVEDKKYKHTKQCINQTLRAYQKSRFRGTSYGDDLNNELMEKQEGGEHNRTNQIATHISPPVTINTNDSDDTDDMSE
ncbi:hypothetical protein JTB14_003270 [Gonioctena quinquepunctata]|nr:hypothetical protein JTB14_003270 [Gonioctena quinquepunctata]